MSARDDLGAFLDGLDARLAEPGTGQFVVHAYADAKFLAASLRAVLYLHQPVRNRAQQALHARDGSVTAEARSEWVECSCRAPYPCRTVRALLATPPPPRPGDGRPGVAAGGAS